MKPYIESKDLLRNSVRKDLLRDEGIRLSPYKDHLGNLTIGIGRNVGARKDWISNKTAFQMLDEDIDVAIEAAIKVFPNFFTLSLNRQRAIVNMMFQLGEARFRKFVKMIKAIRENDWDKAVFEAKNSMWFNDLKLQGRALRVIRLMEDKDEKGD